MNAVAKIEKKSLIVDMAGQYGLEPTMFKDTVRATCGLANSTNEEFAAFLMVANTHGLNPITREIYAFPKKGGGIMPIVSIDGWYKLANSHPKFDGMEFKDIFDDKKHLTAIECHVFRKDRGRPTVITEYMDECKRPTEPWQKWPARMLRHKAAIQAIRIAFGFAGIIDPDEAERSPEVETGRIVAPSPEQMSLETVEDVEHEEIDADGVVVETATEPGEREFNAGEWLIRLADHLNACTTPEELETAWEEADALATLDGDDSSQRFALEMYDAAKSRVS